jgi:hypothetical protein
MEIKKSIGLRELTIGAWVTLLISSTISIANLGGYFNAKERLAKYQSVEKVIQSYRDEGVADTGDQIRDTIRKLYLGIGKEIAYRQFEKTQE